MIGLILCGHGHFATGLHSAIKLIAGVQEKMIAIDFTEGMTSEELKDLLLSGIDAVDSGAGIVIFTDIPGGTPFRQSASISSKEKQISVLAGTSLPMLLGSCFNRSLALEEFVEKALKNGHEGLKIFETKPEIEVDEELDGI